jgi:hypothetical protein
MIRNWRPCTLGALCRGTGCIPLEPALLDICRKISRPGHDVWKPGIDPSKEYSEETGHPAS